MSIDPTAKAYSTFVTLAELVDLPLSARVQTLRAQRDITQNRLAELTALPLAFIEEVESGVERVISTTARLRLARVLRVPASWLQYRDAKAHEADISVPRVNRRGELLAYGKRLPLRAMQAQPDGFWPCPACGAGLFTRTFERRDLEDTPITLVKIHCPACLFQASHEWFDL
jgi:transcriptional regulator with XRE-family HTH domain